MRFARWVYMVAGILGLLMMIPPYFMEEQFNHDHPPAITHPELYYGFMGVTLAWQLLFLVIATDPVRYRPIMLPTLVEKGSFVIAVIVLTLQQRIELFWLGPASIDATLGILFALAYVRTPRAPAK